MKSKVEVYESYSMTTLVTLNVWETLETKFPERKLWWCFHVINILLFLRNVATKIDSTFLKKVFSRNLIADGPYSVYILLVVSTNYRVKKEIRKNQLISFSDYSSIPRKIESDKKQESSPNGLQTLDFPFMRNHRSQKIILLWCSSFLLHAHKDV